jgi:hypothetical protein
MLQATSMLRYPVFVGTSNYNGFPAVFTNRLLRRYVLDYFASEAKQLRSALFPLGPKVTEVLEWLAADGVIENERILQWCLSCPGAKRQRRTQLKSQANRMLAKDSHKFHLSVCNFTVENPPCSMYCSHVAAESEHPSSGRGKPRAGRMLYVISTDGKMLTWYKSANKRSPLKKRILA